MDLRCAAGKSDTADGEQAAAGVLAVAQYSHVQLAGGHGKAGTFNAGAVGRTHIQLAALHFEVFSLDHGNLVSGTAFGHADGATFETDSISDFNRAVHFQRAVAGKGYGSIVAGINRIISQGIRDAVGAGQMDRQGEIIDQSSHIRIIPVKIYILIHTDTAFDHFFSTDTILPVCSDIEVLQIKNTILEVGIVCICGGCALFRFGTSFQHIVTIIQSYIVDNNRISQFVGQRICGQGHYRDDTDTHHQCQQ